MPDLLNAACAVQAHVPHGQPPFAVRDLSGGDGPPAFDVVVCHPTTWHCSYLDDCFFPNRGDADELAACLNRGEAPADLSLVSMEGGDDAPHAIAAGPSPGSPQRAPAPAHCDTGGDRQGSHHAQT